MYKVILISICLVFVSTAVLSADVTPGVRIKDIAHVDGVRSNQLIGYGLVVGLDNSGDSQQALFTVESVANMLQDFGIKADPTKMRVRNVAAVILTADLPAFGKPGDTMDVTVSSMGDAKTLQGGTLLQSPLKAANGEVYAVAQGAISVGGFSAGGGGTSVSKNHTTVGRIPRGAIIEKATQTAMTVRDNLTFSLDDQDFTTSVRIAKAINDKFGDGSASATDAGTVTVKVRSDQSSQIVGLISDIGDLTIQPDTTAKIVVDERTGTVAIGGSVQISPIAISHGNLSVEISTDYLVSQPPPAPPKGSVAMAPATVVPQKAVNATEQQASLVMLKGGSTVDGLIQSLNALKVTPRDIIAILQTIKQAGALHGELQVL
jgi:flagellar P-ring protein FlgI